MAPRTRNRNAVEVTIRALRAADRLADVDAAALAVLRTTAAALDDARQPYDLAILARVQMAALAALISGHAAPERDDLDQFLDTLRAAPVGDAPNA